MKHRLLALVTLIATLQTSRAGSLDWLKPDALSPEKLERLKTELSLSSDQEAKIKAIVDDAKAKAGALEQALRDQQSALDATVRDLKATADTASGALTKLLEAEGSIKQIQLRAVFAIRDVLTPEQQERVAAGMGKGSAQDLASSPLGAKAARIKAAMDSLGIPPTEALLERGGAIEALVRDGKTAEAEAALDNLITESGVNEPDTSKTPDFSKSEPGATDEPTLRSRLEAVKDKAKDVVSFPLLRQLVKAKEALDAAEKDQDAVAAGRILTWAETVLKDK